jgi:hypothetical protein
MFRIGTGIKRLLYVPLIAACRYVRDTFPVWRDEAHAKALSDLKREHDTRIRDLHAQYSREIEAERRQVEALMPKLVALTANYRFDSDDPMRGMGRFVVSTQLSDEFVYTILSDMHRDLRALDYIAERMAHDMVRQIRTIDFARVRAAAQFDDDRRSRFGFGEDFDPSGPTYRRVR